MCCRYNARCPLPVDVAAVLSQTVLQLQTPGGQSSGHVEASNPIFAVQKDVWRYLSHAIDKYGVQQTFAAFKDLPVVPTICGRLQLLGAAEKNATLLALDTMDEFLSGALQKLGCSQLDESSADFDKRLLQHAGIPISTDPTAVMAAICSLATLGLLSPVVTEHLDERERSALFGKLDDRAVGTSEAEVGVLAQLPVIPTLTWAPSGEPVVKHVAANVFAGHGGASDSEGTQLWLPPAYFANQEAVLPHVPRVCFVATSAAQSEIVRTLGVKQMLCVCAPSPLVPQLYMVIRCNS
jgi:hypothetical protein